MKAQEVSKVTIVYTEGPLTEEFLLKISGLKEDTVTTINWIVGNPKCNLLEPHRKDTTISQLCEELEKYFNRQVPEQYALGRYALAAIYPRAVTYIGDIIPHEIYRLDKKTNKFKVVGYFAMPVVLNNKNKELPPSENMPRMNDAIILIEFLSTFGGMYLLFNVMRCAPMIYATPEFVHMYGQWNHGEATNEKTVMYL